jgi:dolichol-phosphate mannosyltransferase
VLKNNYREKNRFLRGYVQNMGFRKTSLEYTAAQRAAGASHYSMRKLFSFSIGAIVGFSNMPLKLGIWAGIVSGLIGVLVLLYTLFTYRSAPSGYATIVVMMCFLLLDNTLLYCFQKSKTAPYILSRIAVILAI